MLELAEAANAPIYTVWDVYMGTGIVGGTLNSARVQAENAASAENAEGG